MADVSEDYGTFLGRHLPPRMPDPVLGPRLVGLRQMLGGHVEVDIEIYFTPDWRGVLSKLKINGRRFVPLRGRNHEDDHRKAIVTYRPAEPTETDEDIVAIERRVLG